MHIPMYSSKRRQTHLQTSKMKQQDAFKLYPLCFCCLICTADDGIPVAVAVPVDENGNAVDAPQAGQFNMRTLVVKAIRMHIWHTYSCNVHSKIRASVMRISMNSYVQMFWQHTLMHRQARVHLKHTHAHTPSHKHTHTLTHSLTHSLTHQPLRFHRQHASDSATALASAVCADVPGL